MLACGLGVWQLSSNLCADSCRGSPACVESKGSGWIRAGGDGLIASEPKCMSKVSAGMVAGAQWSGHVRGGSRAVEVQEQREFMVAGVAGASGCQA